MQRGREGTVSQRSNTDVPREVSKQFSLPHPANPHAHLLLHLGVLGCLIEQEDHRNPSPPPEVRSDGVSVWNPPSTQGVFPGDPDNGLHLFMMNQKNVCSCDFALCLWEHPCIPFFKVTFLDVDATHPKLWMSWCSCFVAHCPHREIDIHRIFFIVLSQMKLLSVSLLVSFHVTRKTPRFWWFSFF